MRKLFVWYLPQAALFALTMGMAVAQSPAEVNRDLLQKWRECVEFTHAISANIGTPYISAEDAFRACLTEEQLFLSALSLSMQSQPNKDRALSDHYRAKLELKLKLNDNSFREMAKQIGVKP